MGLFDKLKDVAKTVADKATDFQAEREREAKLQALERYGSIEGTNIPEKAEFCLDGDNDRFIIRAKDKHDKYTQVFECGYEDFVDFRLIEAEECQFPGWTSTHYHFKLTLATGEEFILFKSDSVYESKTDFNVKRELRDKFASKYIALTFVSVIGDKDTQKWANQLYESDGLLPIFDENGEFLIGNLEANLAKK